MFSFDLMKYCENDRILKMYENLENIHWSVIIHLYTNKAHIEGVQRRGLDQIDEKLSKPQTFINS